MNSRHSSTTSALPDADLQQLASGECGRISVSSPGCFLARFAQKRRPARLILRRKGPFSRAGLTLIEVLITLSILGILMTAVFGVFKMGLLAWHKANTKNGLLGDVQVVNYRLNEELQFSDLGSVTAQVDALSFLSPCDAKGKVVVSSQGRPLFQKYIVYYRNTADKKMYRREVPLSTPATVSRPIEDVNLGSGKKPLSFYTKGGDPLGRNITKFEPDLVPDPISQVTWKVTAEHPRLGTNRPESVVTDSTVYLRN